MTFDLRALETRPVRRVMSFEAAERMIGTTVPQQTPNVTAPGLLADAATGEPFLAYYPLDPAVLAPVRQAVQTIDYTSTMRASTGQRNVSRTFGMAPRKVMMGRESCRPTSMALNQKWQHKALIRLAGELQAQLEEFAPQAFEHDRATMEQVDHDWRIADGSLWTSGIVNQSSSLPYHRDRLNFATWSAMPVMRRQMTGGYLHLPEYDVTVECRDGWVVTFPGFEHLHGVTPMRATGPDAYRYSVVYYALRGMKDCWSYAMELGEARKRRTEREQHMAGVLKGTEKSRMPGPRGAVAPAVVVAPARLTKTAEAGVEKWLGDVARFAELAVASTDLDPTYPVLRRIQEDRGLSGEQRVWSSLCFVGWYRLASALQAPARPGLPDGRTLKLGTGVERRSLRTAEKMRRHWASVLELAEQHGGFDGWLRRGFTSDPAANWTHLRENYGQAWGNGRWATYKLAEVLKEVNGWPLDPPDMGNDGSTGPVAGLHMLYGQPPAMKKPALIATYDSQGADLMLRLAGRGVLLNLAQTETVLCDFHGLAQGAYYVGHDLDLMLSDLHRPEVPPVVAKTLLEARRQVVPHDWLGELRGWNGVDKARRRAYVSTGEVLSR